MGYLCFLRLYMPDVVGLCLFRHAGKAAGPTSLTIYIPLQKLTLTLYLGHNRKIIGCPGQSILTAMVYCAQSRICQA